MKSISSVTDELLKITERLPGGKVEEVVDYAKFLEWQTFSQKDFSKRVDALWLKMKKTAKKAGYSVKDVSNLISEIRKNK